MGRVFLARGSVLCSCDDCSGCWDRRYYKGQTLFVAGFDLLAMQILRELARLRIMLPPLREKTFSAKADVIYYLATDPAGSTLPLDSLSRELQYQVQFERAVGPGTW